MQHLADPNARSIQSFARPRLGKAADADNPLGLQMSDEFSQMHVTCNVERVGFVRR